MLITGCSGGGKSTLVEALGKAGFPVVAEPGRRIVAQARAGNGGALPWVDMAAFARQAVTMARADLDIVLPVPGVVFFDRGVIDAAVALEFSGGDAALATLMDRNPYDATILVAPPWPEIFQNDSERRHDLASAIEEYDRILASLADLECDVVVLPKAGVAERLGFVRRTLGV